MEERIHRTEDYQIYLASAGTIEKAIERGTAIEAQYYWLVSKWARVAIGTWARNMQHESIAAAKKCVRAVLTYFYGTWRETLATDTGLRGDAVWRTRCLWYEEVQCSLPFASALSNWDAVKKIAAYPPEDRLPEAAKARGETAWGWALITYLREEPRRKVEAFLAKAENDQAKRPKELTPVLRALMDKDEKEFAASLLAYLAFYRKSEFKTELDKAIALDGTTLYHLGRKRGFKVQLPKNVVNHVVCFD